MDLGVRRLCAQLVLRLQARGAMELVCPELHQMATRQRLFRGQTTKGKAGKEEL